MQVELEEFSDSIVRNELSKKKRPMKALQSPRAGHVTQHGNPANLPLPPQLVVLVIPDGLESNVTRAGTRSLVLGVLSACALATQVPGTARGEEGRQTVGYEDFS